MSKVHLTKEHNVAENMANFLTGFSFRNVNSTHRKIINYRGMSICSSAKKLQGNINIILQRNIL